LLTQIDLAIGWDNEWADIWIPQYGGPTGYTLVLYDDIDGSPGRALA
jgi:hypothetical protein